MKQTWEKLVAATNAFRKLQIKLCRLAKALKLWEKTNLGNIKQQIAIAKEIFWHFDVAQEQG